MDSKFTLRKTKIIVGDSIFSYLNNFILSKKPSKIFLIVDKNSKQHCFPILLNAVSSLDSFVLIELEENEIQLNNIEISKSIENVSSICSKLLQKNIDRDSLIINLLIWTLLSS